MADETFAEKMAHWKKHGAFGVKYQGGRKFFGGTTIRTEQERIIAQGKARGNDLVPYHSIHGS